MEYTLQFIATVITSDNCNSGHSDKLWKTFAIFVKQLEIFYKMVYKTKHCNSVDPLTRKCITKSNFQYFLKKDQKKKALALKGLWCFSTIINSFYSDLFPVIVIST